MNVWRILQFWYLWVGSLIPRVMLIILILWIHLCTGPTLVWSTWWWAPRSWRKLIWRIMFVTTLTITLPWVEFWGFYHTLSFAHIYGEYKFAGLHDICSSLSRRWRVAHECVSHSRVEAHCWWHLFPSGWQIWSTRLQNSTQVSTLKDYIFELPNSGVIVYVILGSLLFTEPLIFGPTLTWTSHWQYVECIMYIVFLDTIQETCVGSRVFCEVPQRGT